MGDDAVFGDDDDPIADVIVDMVHVFGFAGGRDSDVVSDAGIFVNDGVLNAAIGTDADAGPTSFFVFDNRVIGFVVVAAQEDRAIQNRAGADDAAKAHDGVFDDGVIDDAAVRDDGVID